MENRDDLFRILNLLKAIHNFSLIKIEGKIFMRFLEGEKLLNFS
jgi:hypothetical protein